MARFDPSIINDRWSSIRTQKLGELGHSRAAGDLSESEYNAAVDALVNRGSAAQAHPDDVLDQVLHEQKLCSCFDHPSK